MGSLFLARLVSKAAAICLPRDEHRVEICQVSILKQSNLSNMFRSCRQQLFDAEVLTPALTLPSSVGMDKSVLRFFIKKLKNGNG